MNMETLLGLAMIALGLLPWIVGGILGLALLGAIFGSGE